MTICTKITQAVKSQDLFAVPVQLTYRGERAFSTLCGGGISIILILGLTAYFAIGMRKELQKPEYLQLPPRYKFDYEETTIRIQDGNTLAIKISGAPNLDE